MAVQSEEMEDVGVEEDKRVLKVHLMIDRQWFQRSFKIERVSTIKIEIIF
jgi:hypothetical protein